MNAIAGKIKKISSGEVLFTLSGLWNDVVYLHKGTSKDKSVFFDVNASKPVTKVVAPEEAQEDLESRK